jgi:hypothetical protein
MRTLLFIPAVLALAGFVFSGCTAIRGGKTMVKYDRETAPITTTVPMAGTFGLFDTTDMTPKVRVNLNANDTIGFQKLDNGVVVAVAGNQKIPLQSDTTYYWQRL